MAIDFAQARRSFEANALEVERLLTFDRLIVEVAVDALRQIEEALEQRHLHSVLPVVRNRASILSNVAQSESLRPQYAAMFNQCVVLLVSYFGAAVHTLFRQGVVAALMVDADVPAATEELKVSWRSVAKTEGDREAIFADLLIAQHDISFQDMQSIRRAFEQNLEIQVERSADTNDIIVGQAIHPSLWLLVLVGLGDRRRRHFVKMGQRVVAVVVLDGIEVGERLLVGGFVPLVRLLKIPQPHHPTL